MKPKTVGQRLAAEIERRDLAYSFVAMELKTSPPNVRNWCIGFNAPSEDNAAAIEKWLAQSAGK